VLGDWNKWGDKRTVRGVSSRVRGGNVPLQTGNKKKRPVDGVHGLLDGRRQKKESRRKSVQSRAEGNIEFVAANSRDNNTFPYSPGENPKVAKTKNWMQKKRETEKRRIWGSENGRQIESPKRKGGWE